MKGNRSFSLSEELNMSTVSIILAGSIILDYEFIVIFWPLGCFGESQFNLHTKIAVGFKFGIQKLLERATEFGILLVWHSSQFCKYRKGG